MAEAAREFCELCHQGVLKHRMAERGPSKLRAARLARLALLALAALAACKKAPEPPPSQQAAPPAAPAADPWQGAVPAKDPLPRPFLFAAEKDGKTTHLLGTMHIGVDPEARLPALVWDQVDAATSFAVETDVSDPAISRIGSRSSGTLRDDLGPDYWKKLEFAITPQLAQALLHKSATIPATMLALRGIPSTPPMDGILLARAKLRGKQIVYLEAAARQAAMLEKHLNVKALKLMLDDLGKVERQTKQLLAAYVAGDEAKFSEITDEQRRDAIAGGYTEAEYDDSMEDLLYRRNASWIAAVERMHAGGGAFVAVGAMHLFGKRSVLELLAAKGYQIRRVAPP